MPEVWQPIPGFDGYEASSEGRIRNAAGVIKPFRLSKSYLGVCINSKNCYVHHLVAEAFHGPRPKGLNCCHRNDVADDNRAENLYWGTQRQNRLDSYSNGRCTQAKGSASAVSKLTEEDVLAIRHAVSQGMKQREAAEAFGVSRGAISNIVYRKTWAHI